MFRPRSDRPSRLPPRRSRAVQPAGPAPRRPGRPRDAEDSRPEAPSALALAVSLIPGIDEKHPADAILRQSFRGTMAVDRATSAAVARLVFSFFRWRGLVARGLPLPRQVESAAALAGRFAREPDSFSDESLERVVPAWVASQVSVKAAWLRAIQAEPRLWLRVRPGTADAVAAALGDLARPLPEALPDAVVYGGQQDLFRTPEFQAGHFELQDVASQAVGVLCGPRPGESWWDACAGEGGKTLHLADQMQNKGVVWGTDRAEWRLQRLRMRASRAGLFNVRWGIWDGGAGRPTRDRFDGVLVDAPCSGIGTWQRNPHARWTSRPEGIAELAAVQLDLLRHASAAVKPGGRLVYAVCTLSRAETVEVAKAFAESEEGRPFEPAFLAVPWLSGKTGATAVPEAVWIWPQDLGGNGMFVAAWRRR
jgi:16S rRNA (cytosine967-C5)-methyltransferase